MSTMDRRKRLARMGGQGDNRMIFTADADSITVTTAMAAGAPTRRVEVTESSGVKTTYTTSPFTHNRTAAGAMRVEIGAEMLPWITQLSLFNCGLSGTFTAKQLKKFIRLQQIRFYTNPNFSCRFGLSDLPSTMTFLSVYGTASIITGTLANIHSGMQSMYVHSTQSTLTGQLADLPASMTVLWAYTSSCKFSGGGSLPAGIREIKVNNLSLIQAEVDEIIDTVYTNRASFTYAAPVLDIAGLTNAAPSGIYQDSVTPTTGLEKVYKLQVDPDTEGFNKWGVTYTNP